MALPRVASTVHTFKTLDGKAIHFRPYRMADEQTLLEVKESEDDELKLQTVLNVLEGIVINKVNIRSLPLFEVEHLLIQSRVASVGNATTVGFKCQECDHTNAVELDLSKVFLNDTRPESMSVDIGTEETSGEAVFVNMKYPSFEAIKVMKEQDTKNIMRACVDSITVGDQTYDFSEVTDDEIDEWFLSLTKDSMKKIYDFMETIPKLRIKVEYTCKCGNEHEFVLDDFESFFT